MKQQNFVIVGQLIELGQASVLTLGIDMCYWEGRGRMFGVDCSEF